MQVSVETTSNIERRMTIGVPAQEIDQAVQKRLQETARTVRLNGFRPGKVPMSVVKRRFGDSIRQEVVGEAMRDNYIKALSRRVSTHGRRTNSSSSEIIRLIFGQYFFAIGLKTGIIS